MNPEQHDFEQLRRVLALKRYEQPPPGFYNSFSFQVIARIKAGETAEEASFVDRLFTEAPWIQRLWALFETKPVLAGAVSFAFFGLVATGMFYGDASSGANVGTVYGIVASDRVSPASRVNPRNPLDVENVGFDLPPHLRENPLLGPSQPRMENLLFHTK